MSVVGIPVGNFALAKAVTLPGYAAAVANGARARGRDLYGANAAFQLMLNQQTFDASTIPLHRDLAAAVYQLPRGLSGLGDDVNPPAFVPSSSLDFLTDPSNPQSVDFWNSVSNTPALNPGDDRDATEPNGNDSGSWWTDVLKTFAGPLAMGIGGRIAGQNPWAKPPVVMASTPMSSTTKLVLAGGALLVGGLVLSRILKK